MASLRADRLDASRIDAVITVAVARPHICAALRAAEGSLPAKIDSKVTPDISSMTTTPRSRSAAYSRGASGRHLRPATSRTIPSPPELCNIDVDRKHFATTVRAPAVAVVEPSTQHRAVLVRTPSRSTLSSDSSVPRANAASSSQPSPIATSWYVTPSLATSTVGGYTYPSHRREP